MHTKSGSLKYPKAPGMDIAQTNIRYFLKFIPTQIEELDFSRYEPHIDIAQFIIGKCQAVDLILTTECVNGEVYHICIAQIQSLRTF